MARDAKDGRSSASRTDDEKSYQPFKVRSLRSIRCVGDLEVGKVYKALSDRKAASEGYLRIIDESGEDYLYPAEFFVPVRLPAATVRALGEQAATS